MCHELETEALYVGGAGFFLDQLNTNMHQVVLVFRPNNIIKVGASTRCNVGRHSLTNMASGMIPSRKSVIVMVKNYIFL